MRDHQREFLEFAQARGVLRFGEFVLKSGRVSPYFFNAGLFNSGASLARLSDYYARAIIDAGVDFQLLFGPAYKGIPLAASTAVAFARNHGRDVPYAFNRKEVKDHGEGGSIVGAPLAGRVLVIDDVITAGTSLAQSAALIEEAGARLAGIVIALDRQERGAGGCSAAQEVAARHGVPVVAIANLDTLVAFLDQDNFNEATRTAVRAYRDTYGTGLAG